VAAPDYANNFMNCAGSMKCGISDESAISIGISKQMKLSKIVLLCGAAWTFDKKERKGAP